MSRDDHLEAERLAREAAGLAPAEMPNLRADLLVDLAEILLWAKQPAKAKPVIAEAIGFYERKGNLVSAASAPCSRRLRLRVRALAPAPRSAGKVMTVCWLQA